MKTNKFKIHKGDYHAFIFAIIALLITFILVPVLIPTLKRMKFGQSIREEGPQSHMKKRVHQPWWFNILISIIITSIIAIFFIASFQSHYSITLCHNRIWTHWLY